MLACPYKTTSEQNLVQRKLHSEESSGQREATEWQAEQVTAHCLSLQGSVQQGTAVWPLRGLVSLSVLEQDIIGSSVCSRLHLPLQLVRLRALVLLSRRAGVAAACVVVVAALVLALAALLLLVATLLLLSLHHGNTLVRW